MARFLIDVNLPNYFSLWRTQDFLYVRDIDDTWTDTQVWSFAKLWITGRPPEAGSGAPILSEVLKGWDLFRENVPNDRRSHGQSSSRHRHPGRDPAGREDRRDLLRTRGTDLGRRQVVRARKAVVRPGRGARRHVPRRVPPLPRTDRKS